MRTCFLLFLIIISSGLKAQTDTTKVFRAFPITAYQVDLNDSTKIIQLELPAGLTIADKQMGVLQGTFFESYADTVGKGYGRCNLIKSNFYYFTIGHNKSGKAPRDGDLIYTLMPKTSAYSKKLILLASHFIELDNVYESPFYDRYDIFNNWTSQNEKTALDSMVSDIRFTGKFFKENNPSMNQDVKTGVYKERKVLDVMMDCKVSDLEDFINYIIARPRLYAGKKWKVSETFATWVVSGAPTTSH